MTTRFPLVRFTTGPTSDAEVLFDCVDATRPGVETWVTRDGFTIGVPELLGEPDAVGQQWGTRQPVVPLVIQGSKTAALERQAALARVLMRRRVWMMVQLDASTAPVWWHCYRTQPREVLFDSVYVDDDDQIVPRDAYGAEPIPDLWQVQIQLTADPFGYLERVNLPDRVMGNDPAVSDPPAYRIDLPTLPGDALTYARVGITPDTPGAYNAWTVIATRGDTTAPVFEPIGGADYWQVDPDTYATAGDDPACLGGSYRRLTMYPGPYANMPFTARLSRTLYLAPGRYRALLRVSLPTVDVRSVQLGITASDPQVLDPPPPTPLTITTTNESALHARMTGWVDLGSVNAGLQNLPSDVTVDTTETVVRLWAGSPLTNPDIRLDHLALIRVEGDQVDGDSLTSTFVTDYDETTYIDGDTEGFWRVQTTGDDEAVVTAAPTDTTGGFPRLDPATTNRLHVFPMYGANSGFASTTKLDYPTADRTISVSLHPQVLWLGDGRPNPQLEGTP